MLVIGIGNPDRGDDAVGWQVAEALEPLCDTAVSGGDPAALIERWRGRHDVVLVDATRCAHVPGAVTIIDLLAQRLPPGVVSSSHGMGPLEAVELGRAIDALPDSLTLVGIEGRAFDHGAGLSREVARGAERAVAIISTWVNGGGPR
jgi:hydrogenase maturation protease